MAKINKEEEWRRSGIGYALKIIIDARNEGLSDTEAINKLIEELRFRNITKCPLTISQSELEKYKNETKSICTTTFELLTLLTLHDVYGFGYKRLTRFMERFTSKAECLLIPDCEVGWKDYQEIVEEECGIRIELADGFLKIGRKE